MNKQRRKELFEVTDLLEEAIGRLTEIRDDEQDALDSLPESLQYSCRGDDMQDAIDTLDGFENDINNIIDKINKYAEPPKKQKT